MRGSVFRDAMRSEREFKRAAAMRRSVKNKADRKERDLEEEVSHDCDGGIPQRRSSVYNGRSAIKQLVIWSQAWM
jgi:hypothetical protein